jgi:predicted RNase H-like HicB family nuclease
VNYVYPACFYPEDDGKYSVVFVDFELATFGGNLGEAMYMAADAAAGRILAMLNDGEKLPDQAILKVYSLNILTGLSHWSISTLTGSELTTKKSW